MKKLLISFFTCKLIFTKQKLMVDNTYKKFHYHANPLFLHSLSNKEFVKDKLEILILNPTG
jgi:hypothetical protein